MQENDEFFKQPTFYAMAHVSKFIERGAHRITADSRYREVMAAGVVNPDGTIVVVVLNTWVQQDDRKLISNKTFI